MRPSNSVVAVQEATPSQLPWFPIILTSCALSGCSRTPQSLELAESKQPEETTPLRSPAAKDLFLNSPEYQRWQAYSNVAREKLRDLDAALQNAGRPSLSATGAVFVSPGGKDELQVQHILGMMVTASRTLRCFQDLGPSAQSVLDRESVKIASGNILEDAFHSTKGLLIDRGYWLQLLAHFPSPSNGSDPATNKVIGIEAVASYMISYRIQASQQLPEGTEHTLRLCLGLKFSPLLPVGGSAIWLEREVHTPSSLPQAALLTSPDGHDKIIIDPIGHLYGEPLVVAADSAEFVPVLSQQYRLRVGDESGSGHEFKVIDKAIHRVPKEFLAVP